MQLSRDIRFEYVYVYSKEFSQARTIFADREPGEPQQFLAAGGTKKLPRQRWHYWPCKHRQPSTTLGQGQATSEESSPEELPSRHTMEAAKPKRPLPPHPGFAGRGEALPRVCATYKQGDMFISVMCLWRIFVASSGSLSKTMHAIVTKRKYLFNYKVSSSRIHTSQREGRTSSPQAITAINKNSKGSSGSSVQPSLLLHQLTHCHLPHPVTNTPLKILPATKGRAAPKGNAASHWVTVPFLRSFFQILLCPALPFPISSSSKLLFYYLNLISSHFSFLNNTGYLRPQAWFSAQVLVGFYRTRRLGGEDEWKNRKNKSALQLKVNKNCNNKRMREKKHRPKLMPNKYPTRMQTTVWLPSIS